jgi:hypothetical protein
MEVLLTAGLIFVGAAVLMATVVVVLVGSLLWPFCSGTSPDRSDDVRILPAWMRASVLTEAERAQLASDSAEGAAIHQFPDGKRH